MYIIYLERQIKGKLVTWTHLSNLSLHKCRPSRSELSFPLLGSVYTCKYDFLSILPCKCWQWVGFRRVRCNRLHVLWRETSNDLERVEIKGYKSPADRWSIWWGVVPLMIKASVLAPFGHVQDKSEWTLTPRDARHPWSGSLPRRRVPVGVQLNNLFPKFLYM